MHLRRLRRRRSGTGRALQHRQYPAQRLPGLWAVLVIFPMGGGCSTPRSRRIRDLLQPLVLACHADLGQLPPQWVDANIGEYFMNSFIVVLPSLALIRSSQR
ncbi:MAG: hypothetical protein R2873_27105 [Caldilineaceae bacterium]